MAIPAAGDINETGMLGGFFGGVGWGCIIFFKTKITKKAINTKQTRTCRDKKGRQRGRKVILREHFSNQEHSTTTLELLLTFAAITT